MKNFLNPNWLSKAVVSTFSPGPYICYACQNEARLNEHGLCADCQQQILLCPHPTWLPPLDGLFIGVQYTEPIKNAVLRLKSGHDFSYVPFLAQYMEIPDEWSVDLLVPIPIHPIHEWLRGFNQSELLTQYLSSRYRIPYSNELLLKKKFTRQQKRLTADARRKNVRNSFYAEPECKGLHIVLVDDVFTTGATMYECAKVLKKAGAARVYGCCVASPKA